MKYLDVPMSGSEASRTHSRNRYGQYVRNRSAPVNPATPAQLTVRSRMVTLSQRYATLTGDQRAGWESLGASISRTDSLGQTYHLNSETCFISVNQNRLSAGDAIVDDAPAIGGVDALETLELTAEVGTLEVVYTPTPLGTGERVFVYASPQRSAGVNFEKDLRLVAVSDEEEASPFDILAAYSARFGAPVAGNKIFVMVERYLDGVKSQPLSFAEIVSA